MIKLLVKVFIKNHEDTKNPKIREKYGVLGGVLGIVCNIFLFVVKLIIGLFLNAIAIMSDAFNNLTDSFSSIVSIISAKMSNKKPDKDHPFGHGRAEAISGLVIVVFLALISYEIITGAINKILTPSLITIPDTSAAIMAVVGIIVNLSVSDKIIKIGKEIKSPAIVADGKHQRTDIFSSIAILVGVIVSNVGSASRTTFTFCTEFLPL